MFESTDRDLSSRLPWLSSSFGSEPLVSTLMLFFISRDFPPSIGSAVSPLDSFDRGPFTSSNSSLRSICPRRDDLPAILSLVLSSDGYPGSSSPSVGSCYSSFVSSRACKIFSISIILSSSSKFFCISSEFFLNWSSMKFCWWLIFFTRESFFMMSGVIATYASCSTELRPSFIIDKPDEPGGCGVGALESIFKAGGLSGVGVIEFSDLSTCSICATDGFDSRLSSSSLRESRDC